MTCLGISLIKYARWGGEPATAGETAIAREAGHFNVASKKLNRVYVHGPTNAACRYIRFECRPQRLQQPVQGLAVGALQQ